MSVDVETLQPCIVCGAAVRCREILAAVTADCIVAPREVVWCAACGAEQP